MHITYDKAGKDLQQGDVLERTQEISDLLALVHPHYYKSTSYRYFLVLTQSCDLTRRDDSPCKSRYITLAGVRPLHLAIERELEKYLNPLERLAGVAKLGKKALLQNYISRIYNNNEPTLFYLHDAEGVSEPCCAFLRLSIAIRAHDHYDKCLAARVASLSPEFQAKLGWLVGNVYSRVGTKDWVPHVESESEFKDRINSILDDICVWLPDKQIDIATRKAKNGQFPTDTAEAKTLVDSCQVPTRKEIVADSLMKVLVDKQLLGNSALSETDITKVISKLNTIPEYKQIMGK